MKFRSKICWVVLFVMAGSLSSANSKQPENKLPVKALAPGDAAPNFSYVDPDSSEVVSLNQLKGQSVLLVFYPKAFSKGCVRQLGEYKKEIDVFKKSNTKIIAISTDTQKDSSRFREEYEFPFVLVGDSNLEIINQYNISVRRWMGKNYAQRSVFLIDENGIIQFINIDYQVKSSKQEMYEQIRNRFYKPVDPRLN
jgi:peroxiredoxin Q/BCP